jgi:guanyl-specific ribonuclease Sa
MTKRGSRVAAALLAFAVTFLGGFGIAEAGTAPVTVQQNACGNLAGFGHVTLASLPKEATTTYNLIKSGGPFPHPKNDGVVFTNRQRILPACAASYYHEYTVPTPGARTAAPAASSPAMVVSTSTPPTTTSPSNW